MTRAVEDLGTVASIWAHPDDETYLAGGVMAAAVQNGQRVVCVSATAGEHGTDDPDTWPPERLGAVRREEATSAMAILGVPDHRWLDYEDGTLAALEQEEPIQRLTALLDEVRPDTILTFGPDGITFHPDHQAIGRWTREAWDRTGRRADLLQAATTTEHLAAFGEFYEEAGVWMTEERPVGVPLAELALHLAVAGSLLDRKLDALAAMPSQTASVMAALGPERFRALTITEAFVAAPEP